MIDTHCHFDMIPHPEAYLRQREQAGDIVIGMTNLPSHFKMGFLHVKGYKHIEGLPTRDDQVTILRKLLEKLEGKKKIISVHSRKAEKELFDLLCEYNIPNVIFHWYSGPIDLIPSIISKGYYFSINEAMTISLNGRNIIENIPRDRILTESDAPYNKKADIRKTLINIQISEDEVKNNFIDLLEKIR